MNDKWEKPCDMPDEEVNFRIAEFIPKYYEVDIDNIDERWKNFAHHIMLDKEAEILTKEGVSAELAARHFSVVKNCYVIKKMWKTTTIAWLASRWLVNWTH